MHPPADPARPPPDAHADILHSAQQTGAARFLRSVPGYQLSTPLLPSWRNSRSENVFYIKKPHLGSFIGTLSP